MLQDRKLLALLLGLVMACEEEKPADTAAEVPADTGTGQSDLDGDGVSDDLDCAPDDPRVFPGAVETCDGVDEDCDGVTDENLTGWWYLDADGDGYGDLGAATALCASVSRYVDNADDCDDGDGGVYPGAPEICGGVDANCDGIPPDPCQFMFNLIISEIMMAPAALSDADGEWFEVYNPTEDAVDLEGLLLVDGDGNQHIIAGSLVVSPQDYIVLAASEHAAPEVDYVWGDGLSLVDGDGSLMIAYPDGSGVGEPIDEVRWDENFDLQDGASCSLSRRYMTAARNDEAGSWCPATSSYGDGDLGTPRQPNDYCTIPFPCTDIPDRIVSDRGAGIWGYRGLAAAGDLNADGHPDLVVGGASTSSYEGTVFVLYGPFEGEVALADAAARLEGDTLFQQAGRSLDAGEDINGDGDNDFLVGSRHYSGQLGGAFLVHGPVSGTMSLVDAQARWQHDESVPYQRLGYDVALIKDTDGDGISEVLIGVPGDDQGGVFSGSAGLYRGDLPGDVDLADATLVMVGEEPNDWAGVSVDGAGDVDGDGLEDLLIGAFGHDNPNDNGGAIYLVTEPGEGTVDLADIGTKYAGERESGMAGWEVAAAGDVNGDGYADFMSSGYLMYPYSPDLQTSQNIAVYLFLGPGNDEPLSSLSEADAWIYPQWDQPENGYSVNEFSCSLAGAGDLDGDGFDDLAIGAAKSFSQNDDFDFFDNQGAAWVLRGPVSGTLDLNAADAIFTGTQDYDRFGTSVAAAGDLDGDGMDDLMIGATNVLHTPSVVLIHGTQF